MRRQLWPSARSAPKCTEVEITLKGVVIFPVAEKVPFRRR
jgi:hypothetical protein